MIMSVLFVGLITFLDEMITYGFLYWLTAYQMPEEERKTDRD